MRSVVTMLGGNINIKSQVRRGTSVQIQIPMVREKETPKSTPSSAASYVRPRDDCIEKLKALVPRRTIALHGFDMNGRGHECRDGIAKTLETYIASWYGMTLATTFNLSDIPDVVIVDQRNEESLLQSIPDSCPASIVVLCDSLSNQPIVNRSIIYVSKPFGPYKLAKAIKNCIERTEISRMQRQKDILVPTLDIKTNLPASELDSPMITGVEDKNPTVPHSGSENAHMAVGPVVDKENDPSSGFPFPEHEVINDEETIAATIDVILQRAKRQPFVGRKTDSILEIPKDMPSQSTIVKISELGEETATSPPLTEQPAQEAAPLPLRYTPNILLVEDNSVNLMLLQTFMKKRKYNNVDKAVNGQQAVDAARGKSYDSKRITAQF